MLTKTTAEVADLLGITRMQIALRISRNEFLPKIFAEPGFGRDWSLNEAIRLAVFLELVQIGVSPKHAGTATQVGIGDVRNPPTFFVAWQGAFGMEEHVQTYRDALDLAGGYGGAWHGDCLGLSELAPFAERLAVLRMHVLPLARIVKHLAERWTND